MSRASGKLPNLIVIGAAKCGTTSLHYYLGLHPEIFMSRAKELLFFLESHTWQRGIGWYRSQFSPTAPLRGESTPAYSQWPKHRGVPARMHATIPRARLIYVVRDPVDRLLSEYRHRLCRGEESRSLARLLAEARGDDTCIAASLYHQQIERYLNHFPLDSLLVVDADDLRTERRRTLRRVFDFLGVDPTFWTPRFGWGLNRSDLRRRITPAGRRLKAPLRRLLRPLPFAVRGPIEKAFLLPFSRPLPAPRLEDRLQAVARDLFRADSQALRELTGQIFAGWCV